MNSKSIWTTEEKTPKAGQNRHRAVGPRRAANARTRQIPARRNQAKQTKDDLDDAMDDLNRSTNRLRRKFDPTPNYLETKIQMEQVMDSARRVNQVMTKGNYGTQAQRYC